MSISQPVLFSSPIVPILDAARNSPRPQGDGMDCEDMSAVQQPALSKRLQKRHSNLNASDKSTSISKQSSTLFVPHEPVRGAVKPIQLSTKDEHNPRSIKHCPSSFQEYLKSKAALNENYVISVSRAKGITDVSYKGMPKNGSLESKHSKGSHLNSSDTIYSDTQQVSPGKKPTEHVLDMDNHGTNLPYCLNVPDEERQIEGQQTKLCPETEKIHSQLRRLRDELEVQLKVNADLKKLLVASVGDDLHYKVETLVRTKAHLVEEIGGFAKKMNQDYEDIDQLSIQADMWRTKYIASRVLVDQLASDKESLEVKWDDSFRALQQMLLEREQLNDWLIESHRHLKLTRDSFDIPEANQPLPYIPNMMELARDNLLLAESVKFRLLGSMMAFPAALDAGIQNGPTPAEKLAYQVLSSNDGEEDQNFLATPARLSGPLVTRMERFHPQARFDNITFNCCRKCKGQIHVV